jgi:energy-converting hydrogenase A subunit M
VKYPSYSQTVFDSKISKRVTTEDLTVTYKISENELDLMTKLYQAYKIKRLTTVPTMEIFLKMLIFENMDIFQKKCDYFEIYPNEK